MEVVGLLGHCLFMTPIYTFFDIQGVQLKVESKIQQTKMLVTCQRFGDLFLIGLIWQYSSNHKTCNKGRFKVIAIATDYGHPMKA